MKLRKKRVIVWLKPDGLLKIVLSAGVVVLIAVIYTYQLPATRTWSEWTVPLSGKTIGLDAGHGGPDGGAISKGGVVEKDVNLQIAFYLRDYLQEAGAVVYMTREDDTDLADQGPAEFSKRKTRDLHARLDFIEKKNTDLFLSVHMNATPSPTWYGAQTFFYPSHTDNYTLSSLIQDEIKQNLNNTDRVVKQMKTNFLLKSLKMPSALVEVGFLSNPEEAKRLRDPAYQKRVAAAIYQGILRYYAGEKAPKTS